MSKAALYENALATMISAWQRNGEAQRQPRRFERLNRAYNALLRVRRDNRQTALGFEGGGLGLGEIGEIGDAYTDLVRPKAPQAPVKPTIKLIKKTKQNPNPDNSAYYAAQDKYKLDLAMYKAAMRDYQLALKDYNAAIKRLGVGDKNARADAIQAKKDAQELAMQQARNQAHLYQSGNYGQGGYGFDPNTGQPYPFTYAYDPYNQQYSYPDYQDLSAPDPYAVQASYNAYSPAVYGQTQADTYNVSYYMPGTDDYYEDYGDYPAQLTQMQTLSRGGVRPDVMGDGGYIDSIYADIDSGDIYDALNGIDGAGERAGEGIKTLALVGVAILALMYSAPKKRAR